MATVAADAGVGVGTVYRHFPSREALLGALTHRSFRLVLDAATRAAETDGPGIDAVRRFLDQTDEHGPDLVLPLHGGPLPARRGDRRAPGRGAPEARRAAAQGPPRRHDPDATCAPADLVLFGALLAQQLPHVPDWNENARRLVDIYIAGLAPTAQPLRT
jgi:AcrR family transcriptional regulator